MPNPLEFATFTPLTQSLFRIIDRHGEGTSEGQIYWDGYRGQPRSLLEELEDFLYYVQGTTIQKNIETLEVLRKKPPTIPNSTTIVSHPGHEWLCTCEQENEMLDKVLIVLKESIYEYRDTNKSD